MKTEFIAGLDHYNKVDQAMNLVDAVWIGKNCGRCKRKAFCGDPIA